MIISYMRFLSVGIKSWRDNRQRLASRLRNLITEKLWSTTFVSGDVLEVVSLDKLAVQFLYEDNKLAHFINPDDGLQYSLPKGNLDNERPYLKTGQSVILCLHNNQPLRLELPKNVWLKVVYAPEVVRGDTSGDLVKEVGVGNRSEN